MELFIPSLVVLAFASIFLFIVLPKLSPYVLGIVAITMFGLGLWQHYTMFPYEYKSSLVIEMLKQYSGFIMLAAVIFLGTVGALAVQGGNSSESENGNNKSEIPMLSNLMGSKNGNNASKNQGSIFNLGGNSNNAKPSEGIMASMTNAVNGAMNLMKPANNTKKNNVASASFKTV